MFNDWDCWLWRNYLSQHAVDQSILRQISVQELREAIEQSEIIEDYPDDKYGAVWFWDLL